jgi:hypothetical protein
MDENNRHENEGSRTSDEPITRQETPEGGVRPDPERVAHRAYERFQSRGGDHGRDQDDWFEAERSLITEESDQDRSE